MYKVVITSAHTRPTINSQYHTSHHTQTCNFLEVAPLINSSQLKASQAYITTKEFTYPYVSSNPEYKARTH